MKVFIKTLLFVFVTLITNPKVVLSANVAFLDIQETTTSLSFHKETPKTVFIVIENDWVNRCQNEQGFVAYSGWGTRVETVAAKGGSNIAIQFGKTENQIYHAFRHIDALGLDRSLVQSTVQNHFKTVSSQVVVGKPFNQIIEIGGQRIQYTAFKLSDGTF